MSVVVWEQVSTTTAEPELQKETSEGIYMVMYMIYKLYIQAHIYRRQSNWYISQATITNTSKCSGQYRTNAVCCSQSDDPWKTLFMLIAISWEECLINQNSPVQKALSAHWSSWDMYSAVKAHCGPHPTICSLLLRAHREHKVNERLVLACVN